MNRTFSRVSGASALVILPGVAFYASLEAAELDHSPTHLVTHVSPIGSNHESDSVQ